MVDFDTKAAGFGHAAVLSVHSDGSARFGDFGPAITFPVMIGKTRNLPLNTKVKFGSDGRPTQASVDALKAELAGLEGVSADTIGLVDFKTTDAEASNLDNWMAEQQGSSKWWGYKVGEYPWDVDCRDYLRQGLNAAGLHFTRAEFLRSPNSLFGWLSGKPGASSSLKEKVTHRIIYNPPPDPEGPKV